MESVQESKTMDESTEASIKDCQVCFHAFDGRDRRPRCIPCGHTLCTKCVSDNLKKTFLFCPFCRMKHQASLPTDFPVVYALENILQKLVHGFQILPETPDPQNDPPQGLNKRMKALRQELITSMQSLGANCQGMSSQLQHYSSIVEEWEEQHQQLSKTFFDISQQHEEMAKSMRKEYTRISDFIKEEEEETQRMKMAEERLLAAKVNSEVLPAIEETTQFLDILDNWTHVAHQMFPNVDLITQGLTLQDRSETILQALSAFKEMVNADKTEKESETDNQPQDLTAALPLEMTILSDSDKIIESPPEPISPLTMPTVEEKLKRVLESASNAQKISKCGKVMQEKGVQIELEAPVVKLITQNTQTIKDMPVTARGLQQMMLVMQKLKSGKLFAVKEHEGKRCYAKISLQQNQLCLHVLSHHIPPFDAFILQHSDVMSPVNSLTRKAFLEFGRDQSTLGRIIIDLAPQSKRADNFVALCTGQKGPSYLDSVLYKVLDKSTSGERVHCGDYECNDGTRGKEVIEGAGKEWSGPRFQQLHLAGSVYGVFHGDQYASQFGIVSKEDPAFTLYGVFGRVVTGLKVIRNAISQYSNIRDIKITDCGIVLPLQM